MRFILYLVAVGFFVSGTSLADCEGRLKKLHSARTVKPKAPVISLFKKHFIEFYESSECYENTIRFLENVVPLSDTPLYLVSVENRGPSTLGMVQAEKARGITFKKTEEGWEEVPASVTQKWNHHVFAMDANKNIYDFDYTHKPQIASLKSYLENMFLPGSKQCDLRDKKLEDYRVTIIRAEYALKEKKDPEQKTMTLRKFLEGP